MGNCIRALILTLLLAEIGAVFLGGSVWAVLAGLHASLPVLIGAEVIAGISVLAAAAFLFQRALAAENRIAAGIVPED